MSIRFISLISVFFVLSGVAEARMYQWKNPATGSTQLSGSPPAWYRSGLPGPRVLVFDNGVLVDDTSLPLPADRQTLLREQATSEQEARELAALRRLEEINRQVAAVQARRRERQALEAEEVVSPKGPDPVASEAEAEEITPDLISRMKALIQKFDRDQGLVPR
ncbi:MAG: hypothetical protein K0U93_16910 [Gammaproteobacteria bacterium]|nr:hypothetical protein [Gammaproteobacteria bacterium]